MMRSVLPAMLAIVGGTVSVSSLTLTGIVLGLGLLALGDVLAVASLTRKLAAE